jgi:hypothetical protein
MPTVTERLKSGEDFSGFAKLVKSFSQHFRTGWLGAGS